MRYLLIVLLVAIVSSAKAGDIEVQVPTVDEQRVGVSQKKSKDGKLSWGVSASRSAEDRDNRFEDRGSSRFRNGANADADGDGVADVLDPNRDRDRFGRR